MSTTYNTAGGIMAGRLEGKVALVTGAGSGIGAETARQLANEGVRVSLIGIPAEGIEAVASELVQAGHEAIGLSVDVSDTGAQQVAFDQTVERFGKVDIVVASAAVQLHDKDRDMHEMDDEIWDLTHNINYRGVYLTCKSALAQMVNQGNGGSIIIVASVTAFSGASANVSYLSGKHGLIGLNRHIGVHYAKHGIRCNAICPGALEKTPNHDIHPDPEGRAARLRDSIPMGRAGTPADIAPWIVFLATPEAGYATGATFTIDGGLTVS
jgi:NAD(P)-dependent dehydrogenase (short-subunit alcohol dehydrogenase family)